MRPELQESSPGPDPIRTRPRASAPREIQSVPDEKQRPPHLKLLSPDMRRYPKDLHPSDDRQNLSTGEPDGATQQSRQQRRIPAERQFDLGGWRHHWEELRGSILESVVSPGELLADLSGLVSRLSEQPSIGGNYRVGSSPLLRTGLRDVGQLRLRSFFQVR
jgi:hypothetical protein